MFKQRVSVVVKGRVKWPYGERHGEARRRSPGHGDAMSVAR